MEGIPGGLSREAGVTQEVIGYCYQVKRAVVERLGMDMIQYQPLTFRSQVVTGVNYLVKVQIVDDGSCLFLKLIQPPGGNVGLDSLQDKKWAEDPLIPF